MSKPKESKGASDAKDANNFLWSVEHYFRAIGIEKDALKVSIVLMYLIDVALLWWRCKRQNC